jgi:hypothetical protein
MGEFCPSFVNFAYSYLLYIIAYTDNIKLVAFPTTIVRIWGNFYFLFSFSFRVEEIL